VPAKVYPKKYTFVKADKLEWGRSITDSCVNMDETDEMIKKIYSALF
jgi:phospho-2-dehydro-3-deoxyheptonate aldolase